MARFANVAFPLDGSLLHGFNQRFAKKQPFSAPNDVQRYFVTPKEYWRAVFYFPGLLGSNRDIFFLNLAINYIFSLLFRKSAIRYLMAPGYEPHQCVKLRVKLRERRTPELIATKKWPCYFFESDTTGEKDFEEFFTANEDLEMNHFDTMRYYQKSARICGGRARGLFRAEFAALRNRGSWTKDDIVELYFGLLPEFARQETGKYLDPENVSMDRFFDVLLSGLALLLLSPLLIP